MTLSEFPSHIFDLTLGGISRSDLARSTAGALLAGRSAQLVRFSRVDGPRSDCRAVHDPLGQLSGGQSGLVV